MIDVVAPGLARLGRPFRSLLASDVLMLLSMMVNHVVLPWRIAHQGGAGHLAIYAATLAAVSFFALPLLSPLGDRHSKRTLMTVGLAAMLLESLLQAGMAQAEFYRIEWIVALGVIDTVARAVIMPVSFSIVAELLPAEHLTEGLGYQRSAQAVGRLIGPVVAGAILAASGTATALWVNAAFLTVACLLAWRVVVPPRDASVRSAAQWMHDLRAGLAAKWKIPTERGWTFVSFLVMIFFVPGIGMLVPLKVQSLGLSGAWLGACEAGLSVGMLVGSLGGSMWVAKRVGRFRASTSAGSSTCRTTKRLAFTPVSTRRCSARAPRRLPSNPESALGDAQQFHFELQRGVRRNHAAAGTALAVGDRRRAGELGLAANLHLLHAFGPALDHAVERELDRLAALVGAVELLAVGKGAAVVHFHGVGRRGARALAVFQ